MRRALLAALVPLIGIGCTPRHGSWRHGPIDLSPAPVTLRPPHPLNPGRIRAELCLGLVDAGRDSTVPAPFLVGPDTSPRLVLGGRDTVYIRLVVRTSADEVWAYHPPRLTGPPQSPNQLCYGRPSYRGAPAFTHIELSASRPVRLAFLTWLGWGWVAL